MTKIEVSGRFGSALAQAVSERGLSLSELATKSKTTYEHMRKLLKGTAHPSPHLLDHLCRLLKLDVSRMERMVMQDKLEQKYGDALQEMMGRSPQAVSFDPYTNLLTPEEAEFYRMQMKATLQARRKKMP